MLVLFSGRLSLQMKGFADKYIAELDELFVIVVPNTSTFTCVT